MAEYIKIYGELRRPLEGQILTDGDQVRYSEKENVKQALTRMDNTIFVDVPTLTDDYIIQSCAEHQETVYTIEVGEELHALVGDSTVRWVDGDAPVTKANHTYVVSVLGNLAVWGEFPSKE